jgi:hypothetical protein
MKSHFWMLASLTLLLVGCSISRESESQNDSQASTITALEAQVGAMEGSMTALQNTQTAQINTPQASPSAAQLETMQVAPTFTPGLPTVTPVPPTITPPAETSTPEATFTPTNVTPETPPPTSSPEGARIPLADVSEMLPANEVSIIFTPTGGYDRYGAASNGLPDSTQVERITSSDPVTLSRRYLDAAGTIWYQIEDTQNWVRDTAFGGALPAERAALPLMTSLKYFDGTKAYGPIYSDIGGATEYSTRANRAEARLVGLAAEGDTLWYWITLQEGGTASWITVAVQERDLPAVIEITGISLETLNSLLAVAVRLGDDVTLYTETDDDSDRVEAADGDLLFLLNERDGWYEVMYWEEAQALYLAEDDLDALNLPREGRARVPLYVEPTPTPTLDPLTPTATATATNDGTPTVTPQLSECGQPIPEGWRRRTVSRGNTLLAMGVTPDELDEVVEVNCLASASAIQEGQRIWIPQ